MTKETVRSVVAPKMGRGGGGKGGKEDKSLERTVSPLEEICTPHRIVRMWKK